MSEASGVDAAWIEATLLELARADTTVPQGRTEVEEGDPRIAHYVLDVVAPLVEKLGPTSLEFTPAHDLVAVFRGRASGPCLLLMGYAVAQHANLMDRALWGTRGPGDRYGVDGDCVFGPGTSQNKGPLAAALGALRAVLAAGGLRAGTLILAVNTEGRSSHDGSRRVFDVLKRLGLRPDAAILAFGTSNRISLGNRGRIDVYVTIRGQVAHSSQPHRGKNVIVGAAEAVQRLGRLRLGAQHPILGPEQLTVNQLVCSPVAPHTIPDTARLVIDRRLVPGGTDPERAVAEIRATLADLLPFEVEVEPGALHLPALVDPDSRIVTVLRRAGELALGRPFETIHIPNTFDAGYACAQGTPAVMLGPASRAESRYGADVTGVELVSLHDVVKAGRVYATALPLFISER